MPEKYIVFAGRPNAGKSSIINELTGLNLITGKHAGTTRKVSYYPLNNGLVLVDLPGLGKMVGVSKKYEEKVNRRIIHFLNDNKDKIILAILVLDISTFIEVTWRLEKKGIMSVDVEMVKFLEEKIGEFPLVAANKIDKTKKDELEANLSDFINRISDGDPTKVKDRIFPISAKNGKGIGELKNTIHTILVDKGYKNPLKIQK
ncbi:MAG: 50S ribosome-binding GTPase [Candidatus Bathyarchaeota archaeon]|nr:50S ribosome-binding GTPase [Candidatus Bathyarchaeum tardum]WGM89229.1 MAG: 50S ribosome-binding GTPase [Candidatus Bathyarchaeum tardum]WNZ28533.1 MAG: 50S ribosome-binding GTPase [Candidatus Bathyarchaeota archaeon]